MHPKERFEESLFESITQVDLLFISFLINKKFWNINISSLKNLVKKNRILDFNLAQNMQFCF